MKKYIQTLIKKYYSDASISYTISFSFTLVAVIAIIIVGILFYIQSSNSTEKMIFENNKTVLNQVNINLDNYLRNMMKVSNGVYYNVIKDSDLKYDVIEDEMDLLYESNKDSLISICLFSEYGDVVEASPVKNLKTTVNPKEADWFINAMEKRENLHFSTPHVQNLFSDINNNYRWVVSLSRSVEMTVGGKIKPGVLLVDMNFSGIEQIFKDVDIGQGGYIYLIDSNGEIIYHPRQQLIYSNLVSENNIKSSEYEDGNHIEEFLGEKRIVTSKTAGYTGWKIIAVTPMSYLEKSTIQISTFMLFILLSMIIILGMVNVFISAKITKPIKKLEKSVNELESGAQNVEIEISGSHEIKHLGLTIKSLIATMNKLMNDIVKEQESKRKSELNALQAQINPHFLYNTLDSIIWMIENENYQGSIIMVTSLARLFRISLSKGKNIISIKDELDHVRNYLTIQNIRYKNRFTYEIKCSEEVEELSSIKLIVQPIVENAIYHGMKFMDGDGEIAINAYLEKNEVLIDIIDNGLGMEQEDAELLLQRKYKKKSKGSGIGLINVDERIKLHFGEKYGLSIFSEPDEGTKVTIHLPISKLVDQKEGSENK